MTYRKNLHALSKCIKYCTMEKSKHSLLII